MSARCDGAVNKKTFSFGINKESTAHYRELLGKQPTLGGAQLLQEVNVQLCVEHCPMQNFGANGMSGNRYANSHPHPHYSHPRLLFTYPGGDPQLLFVQPAAIPQLLSPT